ncbi:hypothetical protein [Halobacillus yeomjeoni]|uniref:SynChlorMet cassette protein ScmC n=1 Tax=Halobacillus yeomjeoni TaxID=311194 RepID=A0A931HX34_9BACI|nr:hypothetical protein [Halobacillus yeomjeoni]MBH0230801.1 hypothetical protein [Halobacillus yeomjeoni]
MFYFEAVKKLLAVKTNVHEFNWSFGSAMPQINEEEFDLHLIRLEVIVEDFELPEDLGERESFHYFYHIPESNGMIYVRDLVFNKKLMWKIVNANTSHPSLVINPAYHKYVKFRFINLHSVYELLTDLAAFLLLKEGYAPLYGAAFELNGRTTLTFAPPNTGKTLTSMKACTDFEAGYISEDLSITDGEHIYAVPWTCSYRPSTFRSSSSASKWKEKCFEIFPILELLKNKRPSLIHIWNQSNRIVHRSKCSQIFVLEKSPNISMEARDSKEIYRKVLQLNGYRFHYMKSPLLAAFTYFNPSFTLEEAYRNEMNIIKSLVENADRSFVLQGPDASDYMNSIQGVNDNEKSTRIS